MKSFITYPLESQPHLNTSKKQSRPSVKHLVHLELFKKIAQLDGSIVKCGITPDEGFSRLLMFQDAGDKTVQRKMIAFQKFEPLFEEEIAESGIVTLKVKGSRNSTESLRETINRTAAANNVSFVPGSVCASVPEYLIENPELKIALLNIDLDDYDGTLTALEFLYPRLITGGVLIIENYYKHKSEYKAVRTYFHPKKVDLNNFSVSKGPHYIMKA